MRTLLFPILLISLGLSLRTAAAEEAADAPSGSFMACRSFKLKQPLPTWDEGGGIFAHDFNGDQHPEFIVTSPGHIAAYANTGQNLWAEAVDIKMFAFPGNHPSAIAGDMDNDGHQEIAYLTTDNEIVILAAYVGGEKKRLSDIGEPIAMAIANLRGLGDRDIVLQYSQTSLRAISAADVSTVWETDQYRGIEHSPLRLADLDGDGRDEIAGAAIIDHDGSRMNKWDLGDAYQSMDSIVIADVVPGYPLEVVLAEQRGANSRTDLVSPGEILFQTLNPWNWEDPDKLAVGDFDPDKVGLEIFNRSSGGDGTAPRGEDDLHKNEQAPWVLDSRGQLITKYYLNDKKPSWWIPDGIEFACRIDWNGDGRDEIVAKERHRDGAGAVINPITGDFLAVFRVSARIIYAADLVGDFREEVLVVTDDGAVTVFRNIQSPRIEKPSYWTQQWYRRQKQNWNYYSP